MSEFLIVLYFVIGFIVFVVTNIAYSVVYWASGRLLQSKKISSAQASGAIELRSKLPLAVAWSFLHLFFWPVSLTVSYTIAKVRQRKAKRENALDV